MKIKCLENTGLNLPKSFFEQYGWSENMKFQGLSVDKFYNVYAIFTLYNHPCYLICNDFYDGEHYAHPMFLPGCLFEVIDVTPSKYWIKRRFNDKEHDMNDVGFPEILDDEYFYGGIVEGYKKEVDTFANYKKLIDQENI